MPLFQKVANTAKLARKYFQVSNYTFKDRYGLICDTVIAKHNVMMYQWYSKIKNTYNFVRNNADIVLIINDVNMEIDILNKKLT